MDKHIDELLPFYVNGSLAADVSSDALQAVGAHLAGCAQCRAALREWEELAGVVRSAGVPLRQASLASDLLPLSPVVRLNLRQQPSFTETVVSLSDLIAAQRISMKESRLLPALAAGLLVGALANLFLPAWIGRPPAAAFLILVPLLAVLGTGFLEAQTGGRGAEIIAASPTHPGALIFARLTLMLGFIGGLALLVSLLVAVFGSVPLGGLVLVWLGPLLWLPALTTLLALLTGPRAAAGVSATMWAMLGLLLVTEEQSRSLLGFSLAPLLDPSGPSFVAQVLLAGILWLTCWLWLNWGTPPALRLERSS